MALAETSSSKERHRSKTKLFTPPGVTSKEGTSIFTDRNFVSNHLFSGTVRMFWDQLRMYKVINYDDTFQLN